MKTLGAIFEVKQRWGPFLPGFSGILQRFSAHQNCWGCACNSCTPTQWRNEGGARGDICPRAQHFVGAKLMSECYAPITKCQMSADANNSNLQNVECHCEISSRSSMFAKRAIMNLSDVSRRSFCLQQ